MVKSVRCTEQSLTVDMSHLPVRDVHLLIATESQRERHYIPASEHSIHVRLHHLRKIQRYWDHVYCGIQMWRNITAVTHNIHMLLFESSHFIHHSSTPSIIFTTGVFVSIYCLYCLSVSLFRIDLEVGVVWTRLFWIKSRGQFVQRYMYGSNMVWFWNDSHILEQTTDVDLKKDLCASYS